MPTPTTASDAPVRRIPAPETWKPVTEELLDGAYTRAVEAFRGDEPHGVQHAVDNIIRYYGRETAYAGALFGTTTPNDDTYITPTDLFAVSMLSMTIEPRAAQALLSPGPARTAITRTLRRIPTERWLVDADADLFLAMENLHLAIYGALPPLGDREANRWVLTAKLCARKRPGLFPVRDSVVCKYLGGGPMAAKRMGHYQSDLQVLAALNANQTIRTLIDQTIDTVHETVPGIQLDWSPLRIFDVIVWMHGHADRV